MNVNNNYQIQEEYIQPLEPVAPIQAAHLGNDLMRSPLRFELEEIRRELRLSRSLNEPHYVELISIWVEKLGGVISDPNNYPHLNEVIPPFIEELINLLLWPADIAVVPILPFVVNKLRNPNSVLYSRETAEVINRHLARAEEENIPPELREQLRQREAQRAEELEREAVGRRRIEELRERVRRVPEQRANLIANINRVGNEVLERGNRVNADIRGVHDEGIAQNAHIMEQAQNLRQQVVEVQAQMPLLREQIRLTREEQEKLDQGTVRLKQDVQDVRKEVEERKSSVLAYVVCITLSIVISCIVKKPVVILPDMVQVGS